MEFQLFNLLFVSVTPILAALVFAFGYAKFAPDAFKERVSTTLVNTALTVFVLVTLAMNVMNYGVKVKATATSTPTQAYVPQRQEIETGAKFIDNGPSRIGQFDDELEKEVER